MSEVATETTEHPEHAEHKTLHNLPPKGTVMVPHKFTFRAVKDELGNSTKRAAVTVDYPVPTFDGLVELIEDSKVQDYIMASIYDNIKAAVREQLDDEDAWKKAGEKLDLNKISLKYLAYLPPSERRGGGIAKEVWEAFGVDYIEVMVAATGKEKEKVEKAAALFMAKLQTVKTQKKILAFLKDQLDLYTVSTRNMEEFEAIVEFLNGKITTFMNADESVLLENL